MTERRSEMFVAVLIGAAGLFLANHRLILGGGRWVPGTLQDARLNLYILEHGWRWLIRAPGHLSFWDMPIFYPAANTAAYSDLLLGVGPFYWIWRVLGFAPEPSFELWFLLCGALNYAAGFLLLRRGFDLPGRAAAAGAFLFAFGSPRVGQLEHAQMIPAFYSAAAVYGAVRAFRDSSRSWHWTGLALGGVVAQLYSGFYLGWFLLFGAALFGAWCLVLPKTRKPALAGLKRLAKPSLAWSAAALAALSPLLLHYGAAAHFIGLRSYGEIVSWVPMPQSWFYMGRGSWLYGAMAQVDLFRYLPMQHEHAMGVGFATLACCVAGVHAQRRGGWSVALALAAVSCVLLCTQWTTRLGSREIHGDGTMGWATGSSLGAWPLVRALVPGAAALRAITRVSVFLLLPASIALACCFARRGGAALVALALLCGAEQVWSVQPAYDRGEAAARAGSVAAAIPAGCSAFYAVAQPMSASNFNWPEVQLDAMWAGLERGLPTVNGYSGNFPPGFEPLNEAYASGPLGERRARISLARWEAWSGLPSGSVCLVNAGGRP